LQIAIAIHFETVEFLKCAGVVEEDVRRSNFVSVDEKITIHYGNNRS